MSAAAAPPAAASAAAPPAVAPPAAAAASSSRICVKGLPKYVDAARLKKHFAPKGDITDVKVMRTKEGKSRRFGFVGFREPEEAAAAVAFFNSTYVDTSRIQVELARRVGDSAIARPWSKHSKGSSRHKELHPEKYEVEEAGAGGKGGTGGDGDGAPVDPKAAEKELKFQEFMAAMAPRSQTKAWANEN